MAGKKSRNRKQQSSEWRGRIAVPEPTAMNMLQHLMSMIPDDEKLDFLSSIMGGPPDDFLAPARSKPRTKAQREIDRLLDEARSQNGANEAVPRLLQAEETARKAIGKRFDKLVGRMSEDAAGAIYLEVKVELIHALSASGQREAALALLEETYRLDPSDPLEARGLLLAAYFDLDRTDDADRLLSAHCPEPWAAWLFSRLLVALRRGTRGKEVDEQLAAAHRINPFVLSLLLGERMPDSTPPYSVETGEDSEAQEFAACFLPSWKNTPGAISWLREATARLVLDIPLSDDERRRPRRLTARDYARMPPHRHATWIVGLHDVGLSQIPGDDEPYNHWLTFAFGPDNDLVGFDIRTSQPTSRELWESFAEFMLDEQQPGRPARMLVYPPSLVPTLEKEAARSKILLEPLEKAPQITALLSQLTDRMLGAAQAAESLDPEVIRNAPLNVDEVWEAAIVHLEARLSIAGQSLRPAVALVMSRADGIILWHELFMQSPPEGALANAVRMAIARPAIGNSRRPRQVIVRDPDEAVSLAALSDEAGFVCTAEHELPLIANAIARLTDEFLGGPPQVVLTKGVGTTPADLERYYAAAADYYRAQPWRQFAADEVVGLDVSGQERHEQAGNRRYGLVMGQSGITMGLAIYERLHDIEAMFASSSDRMVCDSFSVMFGEDASIAPVDLDAIEQFGWPVATPEAYPDALRIHPGPSAEAPRVETPTADELRFLTGAMEAITWLTRHRGEKTTIVSIAGASLTATRLGPVGAVQKL